MKKKGIRPSRMCSARNTGDATCIVIGPEGGIEEAEVEWLKENGFTACTLGENIFRAETTPLVVLSVILYESARTLKGSNP